MSDCLAERETKHTRGEKTTLIRIKRSK